MYVYNVTVYIFGNEWFYVNVTICVQLIWLTYRTANSPMNIGKVNLSVYKKNTKSRRCSWAK